MPRWNHTAINMNDTRISSTNHSKNDWCFATEINNNYNSNINNCLTLSLFNGIDPI